MPVPISGFRSGDRVEVRRWDVVEERFRGRRGQVERVLSNGTARVRLENPPTNIYGEATPTSLFQPTNLRLVHRPIQPGDTVTIADPAFTIEGFSHEDEDATDEGYVDSQFYGRTAEAVEPDDYAREGCWMVRLPSGNRNTIHASYLTVVAHGVEGVGGSEVVTSDTVVSEFPFVAGAPVQVAAVPHFYPNDDGTDVSHEFWGATGHLVSRYDDQRWAVQIANGVSNTIHIGSLTVLGPPVEPSFEVGTRVTVHVDARSMPELGGRAHSRLRGNEGIATRWMGGQQWQVRDPASDVSSVVHETWLTVIERPALAVGETVQVAAFAAYRSSEERRITGSVGAASGRVGVVAQAPDQWGNVHVEFPNYGTKAVHSGFCAVLTPEQILGMVLPGDLVRVSTPAWINPDGSGRVERRFHGRIGDVMQQDASLPGALLVEFPGQGSAWVHGDCLTKLDRNIDLPPEHVRCATCRQPVPDGQQILAGDYFYCAACVGTCDCGLREPWSMLVNVNGDPACTACATSCANCGGIHLITNMRVNPDNEQHYCQSCSRQCQGEDCDEMIWGGSHRACTGCREDGPAGLIWRHTVPTMWLGGPTRKEGGYYLGFEDEISASGSFRLNRLRLWAEEHFGHKEGLDLKSDSTVSGFEIATMPMTPAYFEQVDWDSFFTVLNEEYPISGQEPDSHGLHVHIGRQAFRRPKWNKATKKTVLVTDDGMIAAFTYLLAHHTEHLERISRRSAGSYREPVVNPVKAAAAMQEKDTKQKHRLRHTNVPRGAVNLTNKKTIEVRSFRAARTTAELKDAVRLVYCAAEYVRFLRSKGAIKPGMLSWAQFSMWVGTVHPQAFASISGLDSGTLPPEAVIDLAELTKEAERFRSQPVSKGTNRVMEEGEPQQPILAGLTPLEQSRLSEEMRRAMQVPTLRVDEGVRYAATTAANPLTWTDLVSPAPMVDTDLTIDWDEAEEDLEF